MATSSKRSDSYGEVKKIIFQLKYATLRLEAWNEGAGIFPGECTDTIQNILDNTLRDMKITFTEPKLTGVLEIMGGKETQTSPALQRLMQEASYLLPGDNINYARGICELIARFRQRDEPGAKFISTEELTCAIMVELRQAKTPTEADKKLYP